MIELVLYTRAGCHLCEEMAAGLAAIQAEQAEQAELGFRVREIEVGWEGPLADRYGRLLPVLEVDGREVCHYFLDEEALREALVRASNTAA